MQNMTKNPNPLKEIDLAILRLLQRNARLTAEQLGQELGISTSNAQRRLQHMRDSGVIAADVIIIEPKSVGVRLLMVVELELERDRPELLPALHAWIAKTEQLQQAWHITGRGDYMIIVLTKSIEEFDALMERLLDENRNIRKFTTSVALKTLKRGLTVPLD
jgi:Lrp/AsnC family transcriptional regulator, leucine-responsive regulatory protein